MKLLLFWNHSLKKELILHGLKCFFLSEGKMPMAIAVCIRENFIPELTLQTTAAVTLAVEMPAEGAFAVYDGGWTVYRVHNGESEQFCRPSGSRSDRACRQSR